MAQDRFNVDPGPDPRAVAFLEGKGLQRSWRWASMWQREHAFGFTLAGVYRLDVLAAAKDLVTQAVAEGETYQTFRAQFEERLNKLGFAGPQLVTDFTEGPRKVDLTASWRTKVIYDTNVRQAYAAAEWQAIADTAADFPALQYQHTPQEHPRQQHLAWDKMVLPVSHPFWRTHFPPNGWYCKCWTLQVSVDELASGQAKLTSEAELAATGYDPNPATWPTWKHGPTGREAPVPEGLTPGFGYNAGLERRANLGELLERRVEALDPNMARAAAADLANLPVFHDLVEDAVDLGQARAAARASAAEALRKSGAPKAAIDASAAAAADQAGAFKAESWPVGVLPRALQAELGADAPALAVANASAIGHSAHLHPTTPRDWARVQLMLELGEAWLAPNGDLTLFGTFAERADQETTWTLVLKPVAGAWRVRTLFQSSPRRRARISAGRRQVRRASGPIRFRE